MTSGKRGTAEMSPNLNFNENYSSLLMCSNVALSFEHSTTLQFTYPTCNKYVATSIFPCAQADISGVL